MTAAIALSIVLVIGVAGVSLAMQTQRPPQALRPRPARPQPVRRPVRERRSPPPPPPPEPKAAETKAPEFLRFGKNAPATVLGVIDERTTGSIVRSRLNLRVEPEGGAAFEVTIRHVFSTLEARGNVRVGGKVAVRFDPDDHSRAVIAPDTPAEGPSGEPGGAGPQGSPAPSGPTGASPARTEAAPGGGEGAGPEGEAPEGETPGGQAGDPA